MSQDQEMKVALVTGGARRLGAATVKMLHQHHYRVLIHYRHSQKEAEQLANELNEIRVDSARVLQGSLDEMDVLPALIESAVACWQRLDLLVNNASAFFATPLGEVTLQDWQSLMTVNVQAPFFLSQAAWPHLKKQKGNIIHIADIHGVIPLGGYSVYSITKAALLMMTKSLAKEMGPDVRVNAISPGAILPPEGENTLSQAQQAALINKTYLKCSGSVNAIAKAALYLAQATYVTGQVCVVDGGRSVG